MKDGGILNFGNVIYTIVLFVLLFLSCWDIVVHQDLRFENWIFPGAAIVLFMWIRWMIVDIKGFFLAMGRDIDKEIEEDNKAIDASVRTHFEEIRETIEKEVAAVDKDS